MKKTSKHLHVWTEPLPPSFRWEPDFYVGGTPEFAVELSKNLVSLGIEVTVYYDGVAREVDDVTFLPRDYFPENPEYVLSCNSSAPSPGEVKNLYWTSLYEDRYSEHFDCDTCFTLSNFHKSLFGESVVLPLGVYPERYNNTNKENLVIYTSSPDRGGKVIKDNKHRIEKETGWSVVLTYESRLSEQEMDNLYNRASIWVHPMQGIELFCQSSQKAQAAGCLPVYRPKMALSETVTGGRQVLDEEDFIEVLIDQIKCFPGQNKPPMRYIATWEEVAAIFIKYLV